MLDVLTVLLGAATVAAAVAGLRWPGRTNALAGLGALWVAAMLAIALVELQRPAIFLSLGLACLMLGIIVGTARSERSESSEVQLQRHLARCRRRGETASVLLVELAPGAPIRKDVILEALRITDSSEVKRVGRRWELHAILDGDDVQREIVERRIEEALKGAAPAFGWATFPADGLTFDALLETARDERARRAGVPTATSLRAAAGSRAPDDPAPAT